MHVDITDRVDQPVDRLIELVAQADTVLDGIRDAINAGTFDLAKDGAEILAATLTLLDREYPADAVMLPFHQDVA